MQASTKENDLDFEMLRAIAKAEALRPLPVVPKNLEQWLQKQVQVQSSAQPGGLSSISILHGRRQSLQIGSLGLLGGALLGGASVHWFANRNPSQTQPYVPSWVDAIAQYQSLYARETVSGVPQSSDQAQTVVRGFAQAAQVLNFTIPDLSSQGFHFQRAQRLNFNSIPLLQIVYLAAEGLPLALCAMPAKLLKLEPTAEPSSPTEVIAHGMSNAYWQRNDLAWVIVANWPLERVQALSNLVANK